MLSPVARFRHPSTTRNLATLPPFTPFNPHHRPINHSLLPTWATYYTPAETASQTGSSTATSRTSTAGVSSSQAAGIVIGMIILLGILLGMVVVLIKGQMGWSGWSDNLNGFLEKRGIAIAILQNSSNKSENDVESGGNTRYRQLRFKAVEIIDKRAEMLRKVGEVLQKWWIWTVDAVKAYIERRKIERNTRLQAQDQSAKRPYQISTTLTSTYDLSDSSPTSDEFSEGNKDLSISPVRPKGPRSMTGTASFYTCTYPPGFSSDTSSTSEESSLTKCISGDSTTQAGYPKPNPVILNTNSIRKKLNTLFKLCCDSIQTLRKKYPWWRRQQVQHNEVKDDIITTCESTITSTISTSTPELESLKKSQSATESRQSESHSSYVHSPDARDSSTDNQERRCTYSITETSSDSPSESRSANRATPRIPAEGRNMPATDGEDLSITPPIRPLAPRPRQQSRPLPPTPSITSPSSNVLLKAPASTADGNSDSLSGIESLGEAWARAGRAHCSENRSKHVTWADSPSVGTSDITFDANHGVYEDGDTPPELRLPQFFALGASRGERTYQRRRRERYGCYRREET